MEASFLERLPLVFAQFIPFMIAIVFHEAAHAFVASRHGDFTARELGRETLNPFPHIDPIGTVLFPLINMLTGVPILFGWAKPVPVNYNRLKPYRRGLFLVSMAGIAMNLLLAFLGGALLIGLVATPAFSLTKPFVEMAKALIGINLSLAFFNLIPIPPLDGSKAIEAFLSYNQVKKIESFQTYGFWILLALLFSGALNYIVGVPVMVVSELILRFWLLLFGQVGIGISIL